MCCSCVCVYFFFGSAGRRAARWEGSGAGVTALTVLVAISRESKKQLFSQLVERAPSTRSLFIQLRVASATRVSAHNRLALLYCCAAAAISLCVSAPVREQIPKRAHTV